MPQLWVAADPNGAGKTTLADRWLSPRVTPKPPPEAPSTKLPEPPKNTGVDISTLTRMLENGEL